MSLDFAGLVADLEAESADLRSLLAGLDEAAWSAPTPAPGWSIADQVSHLAHFDEATVAAITGPDAFRRERDAHLADIPGLTESVAAHHRGTPGPDLLAWFDRARRSLLVTARASDPRARMPWYGPDMSVASAVTARVMETWAHGQDISDTVGVTRRPGPGLRHVADLGVRTRANSFTAHGMVPPEGPVRVVLAAPTGETWTWGPEGCEDTITGSAEAFCLVVTQRRHPAGLDLTAAGPIATAWMEVAQAFAGPPGAKRPPQATQPPEATRPPQATQPPEAR